MFARIDEPLMVLWRHQGFIDVQAAAALARLALAELLAEIDHARSGRVTRLVQDVRLGEVVPAPPDRFRRGRLYARRAAHGGRVVGRTRYLAAGRDDARIDGATG